MGHIYVEDYRTLYVVPFDKSQLKNVRQAIQNSKLLKDLGMTIQ